MTKLEGLSYVRGASTSASAGADKVIHARFSTPHHVRCESQTTSRVCFKYMMANKNRIGALTHGQRLVFGDVSLFHTTCVGVDVGLLRR